MAKEWAKSFYKSKAWQETRAWVLHRDRMACVRCRERGLIVPAEEVHHIIHLTKDNIRDRNISLNPRNLISLCYSCHKKEHEEERVQAMNKDTSKPSFTVDYVFDKSGNLVKRET